MIELTHAELRDAAGTDLGTSAWVRLDQERIDGFAEVTGDRQWIHVDPARAAEGPFGRTIAHGFLTLSLVPVLLAELYSVVDETRGLNYGLDTVRFTAPVPVDSDVRLTGRIVQAQARDDAGVSYRMELTLSVRGVDGPALVCSPVFVSYGP